MLLLSINQCFLSITLSTIIMTVGHLLSSVLTLLCLVILLDHIMFCYLASVNALLY